MKILCIGDIVGKSGAEMVASQLKYLKMDYEIDFVIANGENCTTGNGINRQRADLLLEAGVDVITMGNHTFSKREVIQLFEEDYPILRPLNLQRGTPGKGYLIKSAVGRKIAVINLIGRAFMQPCDCPFLAAQDCIEKLAADLVFVDFHAEATSEKKAMGWFLNGSATCVFGTHTHVQTADECILNKKTAYITDIGMTGPEQSVLGIKTDIAVRRFLTMMNERYEIAEGNCSLCGIIVTVNDENQAIKIERLEIK